jgi:cell wall-associated NlpC family hydrolase
MIEVPAHFFSVQYNGRQYPGTKNTYEPFKEANCQLFAYELLRYFGKQIPDFRSSDLWEDELWTYRVSSVKPLDLFLYNSKNKSWGAHVGIYLGGDKIIHLSKEIKHPIIWSHQDFLSNSRYKFFIGAKRLCNNSLAEEIGKS